MLGHLPVVKWLAKQPHWEGTLGNARRSPSATASPNPARTVSR
jgi:hypothetical protein